MPFLILQGGKDEAGLLEYSRRMMATLQAAAVEIIYGEFPELDHLATRDWGRMGPYILAFLETHLHPATQPIIDHVFATETSSTGIGVICQQVQRTVTNRWVSTDTYRRVAGFLRSVLQGRDFFIDPVDSLNDASRIASEEISEQR